MQCHHTLAANQLDEGAATAATECMPKSLKEQTDEIKLIIY